MQTVTCATDWRLLAGYVFWIVAFTSWAGTVSYLAALHWEKICPRPEGWNE